MKKEKTYSPPKKTLQKYADVLVHYALNNGKGIKKDDVVMVYARESAKPLYAEVLRTIWKAGGHVIQRYQPTDEPGYVLEKDFYELASEAQLTHFPKKYLKGLVDEIDHSIYILSETDMTALKRIDSQKILKKIQSMKPYKDWLRKKENKGTFSWTLASYGTPQMAQEAKLTVSQYWNQITKACFLDTQDPVATWKKVEAEQKEILKTLNSLPIDKLHIEGEDVDLWVTIGEKRKWIAGGGCNIPSFEVFTSPDWRGTQGWIRFDQPLYVNGNLVEGIELTFQDGKVVKSNAKKNKKILTSILSAVHGDRVGEFSLTDKRHSKITKFMANTLYDENVGGKYGNTHIAVGSAFHECYKGDPANMKKRDWEKLGFNDSSVHVDLISTKNRTVTAHLKNGKTKVIYKNGSFVDTK